MPEVSSQTTPLNILKRYRLRPAIKRPTLSILFLHSCKISPTPQWDKHSYVRKSKPPFLWKTAPTTDKATVLGNQSLNYSWLPWQWIKPARVNHRERERGGGHLSQRHDCTTMLLWAYQRIFGHLTGVWTMSTNALPHWSVSKHHRGQQSLEKGSQETSWLITSSPAVDICCWAMVLSTPNSQSARQHTCSLPWFLSYGSWLFFQDFFY